MLSLTQESATPNPSPPEASTGADGLRRTPFLVRFWRAAWRRKSGLVACLFLLAIIVVALLAPHIAPRDPNAQFLLHRLRPPMWAEGGSAQYILGTDHLGRDVLSRILHGARISLAVGITAVLVSAGIGVPLGLWAGYAGGRVDNVLMRIADIQMAFPAVLLAIAIIAVVGPSLTNLILVLGVTGWVVFARVARAQALVLREVEYVQAARAMGASDVAILFRHVLPNAVSSIIVVGTTQVAQVIISEAALSFLGLGVPISVPTWGGMLNEAKLYLSLAGWLRCW
ncbi:MAG: ABC transporter permease, partial [Limnochordales bacterium]